MTPEEYQQTVRELAHRAAMPDGVAARMEARLEQAFESSPSESRNAGPRWTWAAVLTIAATVVVAIGGTLWYARHQRVTSNDVTVAPATKVHLKVDATDPVHLKVDATNPGSVRLQADQKSPKNRPPVIQPAGFVPVPAAARLPQFESGVIVRLALPVTALPSYGVDISPASSDQPVEADVLIGQDGLARAIRLVNSSRSQQ